MASHGLVNLVLVLCDSESAVQLSKALHARRFKTGGLPCIHWFSSRLWVQVDMSLASKKPIKDVLIHAMGFGLLW